MKLDVDDSSFRNLERIEFEGLLRNSERKWLMGFMSYGGFGSNLLLTLQAIKYSLLVACDRGFRNVIYNFDFTDIIQLTHDDFNKYHLFRVIIFDIKELLI
jgi:hypothetical protein